MRALHGEALQGLAEIAVGNGSRHGCTAHQSALQRIQECGTTR
jgi:hypothetical protein